LGWHPKDDKEIFNFKEALKKFKIKDMQSSPAIFDRVKLDFFNGQYLRQLDSDEFVKKALPFLDNFFIETQGEDYILKDNNEKNKSE